MDKYQCSVTDRERVLEHAMSIIVDEFLKNLSKIIDSGNVCKLLISVGYGVIFFFRMASDFKKTMTI